MKKIGIVGGIGWPSTIEYYRIICEASQLYHEDMKISGPIPMPEILIESLNMNFTVNNRGSNEAGSWKGWDEYFRSAVNRLEQGGAELILIASVTPHARLKEITRGTKALVVSIYDSIGAHCIEKKINNLLVLGTLPTMTSLAFKYGLEKYCVNVIHPKTEQLKSKVTDVIDRLYQNKTEGAASEINNIVRCCISKNELDKTAICLGCTELPLAFSEASNRSGFKYQGLRYINPSVIHALSAFQQCVQ